MKPWNETRVASWGWSPQYPVVRRSRWDRAPPCCVLFGILKNASRKQKSGAQTLTMHTNISHTSLGFISGFLPDLVSVCKPSMTRSSLSGFRSGDCGEKSSLCLFWFIFPDSMQCPVFLSGLILCVVMICFQSPSCYNHSGFIGELQNLVKTQPAVINVPQHICCTPWWSRDGRH